MNDQSTDNVFVKYLPAWMHDEALRVMFSSFGEIISAKVMVERDSGASLGYGYV